MLRRYDLKNIYKKKKKIYIYKNNNYNENKSSTVLDLAQFVNTTNKTLCLVILEMPLWLNTFQYNQTNVCKYLTEGMWGRGEYCLERFHTHFI